MFQDEDVREYTRVKKDFPVKWSFIGESGRSYSGRGKVRDVSYGGLCLEINRSSVNFRDAVFHVEPESDEVDFLPREAELMWMRPMKLDQNACFCGVRFRHPSKEHAKKLEAKVQEWINDIGSTTNMNILNQYINNRSTKRF